MLLTISLNLTCRESPYAMTYKRRMTSIECEVILVVDPEREKNALRHEASRRRSGFHMILWEESSNVVDYI